MANAYRLKVTAVWVTLALVGGGAFAQGTAGGASASGGSGGAAGTASSSAAAGSSTLAAADRTFLMRAAADGLFEVEAARLASDKTKDEAVKRYAAMLVEQHTAANQELMDLAQGKGLTLPSGITGGKRRELDRLKRATGEEFDATFVQTVGIRDHRGDVGRFREASRTAKDPEVKAWATKMLPILERHVSEARALPAAKRPMTKPTESTQ